MATVRLNEKLNKEIIHKAACLYDSRIVASNTVPPEFNAVDIYELWLDSEPGLRADIQIGIKHNWLNRVKTFQVKSLNNKSVDVQCHESPQYLHLPLSILGYGAGLKLHGERASELYVIWKDWKADYARVRQQRDQFQNQITNLLARHQTLKQALGEWPALWDFVPKEFKDKHNEEKAKASTPEDKGKPAVDLDVLNGAVVTAKILKGGFGT